MNANPEYVKIWQSAPDASQQLIVRVTLDMGIAERRLRELDIEVRRRCKLISGFVITCTGKQAQGLALEPWVLALEPDAPVSACVDNT